MWPSLARESGLKNVFVSNGYIGEEAAQKIIPFLDGINIDLKGDDQFYRKVCGAKLEPVQHNIERFWKKGVWVEVTTLIIPGYNDSEQVLTGIAEFLAGVSPDMPWHVSAFYPMHKMLDVPATGIESLRLGLEDWSRGWSEVCLCGQRSRREREYPLLQLRRGPHQRQGYRIMKNSLIEGHCGKCGTALPGVWS